MRSFTNEELYLLYNGLSAFRGEYDWSLREGEARLLAALQDRIQNELEARHSEREVAEAWRLVFDEPEKQ